MTHSAWSDFLKQGVADHLANIAELRKQGRVPQLEDGRPVGEVIVDGCPKHGVTEHVRNFYGISLCGLCFLDARGMFKISPTPSANSQEDGQG